MPPATPVLMSASGWYLFNQFNGPHSGINLANAALHQYEFLSVEFAFDKGKSSVMYLVYISEQAHDLLVFLVHGVDDSNRHKFYGLCCKALY